MTDVLVDTGAMTLCLPIDVIRDLGLSLLRTVPVTTATRVEEAGVYEDAKVTIEGRTGSFDCIALPEGSPALLGVVPLEWLGLEPDLVHEQLRVLPASGRDTYLFIY